MSELDFDKIKPIKPISTPRFIYHIVLIISIVMLYVGLIKTNERINEIESVIKVQTDTINKAVKLVILHDKMLKR